MCSRSVAGLPSIRSGACGLPYYCTPPVTIPTVLGVPAVWQHNNKKKNWTTLRWRGPQNKKNPTLVLIWWFFKLTWQKIWKFQLRLHKNTFIQNYFPEFQVDKVSYRHTKPLSDPTKRRPWEEATHTPVCPRPTFRCVCTVNSNRHVSPHVLSTDCWGESTNAAATLPSRSLASRCGEHLKYCQEHYFHRRFFGR